MTLQKISPYVFAFTLFLSATLVFSVQPMLGKMMLPHVGGSPSGWAVTMFFFQTCLLFGYGLAYVFSKMPPFLNTIAILFMFIPGALFLPIAYQSGLSDSVSPFAVFIQLTLSTAVPFLALSTLSPGLQRLFSFSNHSTAGDPYYLYAASNLGSFTGLLAYPIILEPLIGLQAQSNFWMMLYSLLALAVISCALIVFLNRRDLISFKLSQITEKTKKALETHKEEQPITWKRRFTWLCLAAIPSSLMIGVTTEITTDIASAPMIWVIPLGLYLVTSIIAFSKRKVIETKLLSALHILGVIVITTHIMMDLTFGYSLSYALTTAFVYISVFTIVALTLHVRLANDRPATDKLTEFYLLLALGGAIGGSFNAFIAPLLLNDIYEFHAVLILSLLFTTGFNDKAPQGLSKPLIAAFAISVLLAIGIYFSDVRAIYIFIPLIFMLFFTSIHTRTLFGVCVMIFLALILCKHDFLASNRNFFGVTKIYDGSIQEGTIEVPARIFRHGTTIHGFQTHDQLYSFIPVAYYGPSGPVGSIIVHHNMEKIAVLGLGTGQLACYKKPGREFTFYEIDPFVIEAAKEHFTVLEVCGYKDIILGDARLELKKSEDIYDTIFVDTFSSDAIPIHLITKEAIETYFDKLTDDGVLALHISNRYLDLTKPLAAIAKENNYIFRTKSYEHSDDRPYELYSQWVILTKNKNLIPHLDREGWTTVESTLRPWTDDYSNYMGALNFLNFKSSTTETEN